MKAVILAAGKGSRISDEIGDIPKSLLEIKGEPVIYRTTRILAERNFEVAICTGYRHRMIEEALTGLPVRYYHNPFFDCTNNIASLWFARGYIKGDDCLILSADVVFHEDVIDRISEAAGDLVMVTDTSRIGEGDYFFHKGAHGEILGHGPDIPVGQRDCEYVGLCKISKRCSDDFSGRLSRMVDGGMTQCYFENVFFSYIGEDEYRLETIDIAGCTWREIDVMRDYEKAREEFRQDGP